MMYCKYLCSLLFSFFFLLGWTQEVEFTCSFGEPNQNVGGKDGMERLIRNEFVYPATLYEKGEEGLVKIQYRLTQSGQPIEVTTISSTHPDCKAMAEWIFSKIEFYKDDKRGVKPVYEFRLSFIPKKYKKLLKKRPFTTPPTPYTPIDSSGKVYVYNTIEEKPTPLFEEGNYQSIDRYFNAKIKYPEAALRIGISGEVVLSFVVETSGLVSNIRILESLQGGCNEEAIRLLESLRFMPGIVEGKAVRVKMKTRVNFGSRGY